MAADTLFGDYQDNTHVVDDVGDVVKEQGGIDTVRTTLSSYTLPNPFYYSEYYYDAVSGTYQLGDFDNALERLEFAGTGNFHGIGNALSNEIVGGEGNDTLDGGSNDPGEWDTLIGGDGDDYYRVIGSVNIVETAYAGIDTVEYIDMSGHSTNISDNIEKVVYSELARRIWTAG
jgi:Ca2+-binding RTX toxin-like protein